MTPPGPGRPQLMVAPLAQGMGGDGGMGAPIVMVAAMAVFALLVIAALVWLIRLLMRKRHGSAAAPTGDGADAERVLARRYAEGEIDAEEYRRRSSVLGGRG